MLKKKEQDLLQREIAAEKKNETSDLMINYLEEFVKREKSYAVQIKVCVFYNQLSWQYIWQYMTINCMNTILWNIKSYIHILFDMIYEN